jgi:hypothetical protein
MNPRTRCRRCSCPSTSRRHRGLRWPCSSRAGSLRHARSDESSSSPSTIRDGGKGGRRRRGGNRGRGGSAAGAPRAPSLDSFARSRSTTPTACSVMRRKRGRHGGSAPTPPWEGIHAGDGGGLAGGTDGCRAEEPRAEARPARTEDDRASPAPRRGRRGHTAGAFFASGGRAEKRDRVGRDRG